MRTARGARGVLAVWIVLGPTVAGCRLAPAPTAPSIVFDHVPPEDPGGTFRFADVDGRVAGARRGQRIVLYARAGSWYVQPFADAPFTEVREDSTWSSRIHLGTEYAALLVDPDFQPPAIAGALPSLGNGVIAAEVVPGTPSFWRRRSVRLAAAAAAVAAGLALHLVRVRRLTRQLYLRAEERLAERSRIAQSLYDTLLQGLLGASMRLHLAVEDLPPDSLHRARFAAALATIGEAAEEGRKVLKGLRGANSDAEPIDRALVRVAGETAGGGHDLRVNVVGAARPVHPVIRDEVYSVSREALVNALRHARARAIDVEIKYSPRTLSIVVRDDGCGIGSYPAARASGAGLCSMEARAKAIGARLRVRSRPGAGTEVALSVPGAVAYTAGPAAEK